MLWSFCVRPSCCLHSAPLVFVCLVHGFGVLATVLRSFALAVATVDLVLFLMQAYALFVCYCVLVVPLAATVFASSSATGPCTATPTFRPLPLLLLSSLALVASVCGVYALSCIDCGFGGSDLGFAVAALLLCLPLRLPCLSAGGSLPTRAPPHLSPAKHSDFLHGRHAVKPCQLFFMIAAAPQQCQTQHGACNAVLHCNEAKKGGDWRHGGARWRAEGDKCGNRKHQVGPAKPPLKRESTMHRQARAKKSKRNKRPTKAA